MAVKDFTVHFFDRIDFTVSVETLILSLFIFLFLYISTIYNRFFLFPSLNSRNVHDLESPGLQDVFSHSSGNFLPLKHIFNGPYIVGQISTCWPTSSSPGSYVAGPSSLVTICS